MFISFDSTIIFDDDEDDSLEAVCFMVAASQDERMEDDGWSDITGLAAEPPPEVPQADEFSIHIRNLQHYGEHEFAGEHHVMNRYTFAWVAESASHDCTEYEEWVVNSKKLVNTEDKLFRRHYETKEQYRWI